MATATMAAYDDKLSAMRDKESRIDAELRKHQADVRYDTREYTVEHIVQKFHGGEFFVPDYQRQFVWDPKNRSRFVESVLVGLPIPLIVLVSDPDRDGRFEIVDGVQRIQTLVEYIDGRLVLEHVEFLKTLDGSRFEDLPALHRRKFENRLLRSIVLDDTTTFENRRRIFERVNTLGVHALSAEIRRGAQRGPFMEFVRECAGDLRFRSLCPISKKQLDRREDEELVLRFFAYLDRYQDFRHSVGAFLDGYAEECRELPPEALRRKRREFDAMLGFVGSSFPNGFARPNRVQTPRVRFEALSVGTALALRSRPDLVPPEDTAWIESDEFLELTTTHASNSAPRLRARIEYVRDRLIAGA